MEGTELFAVKIMREKHVNTPEKVEKFMNEVRLLSRCSSPNVVQIQHVSIAGTLVKSCGSKRPAVYYVMRYAVYGEIFSMVQDRGRLTEQLARTFFVQIIKGNAR